MLQDNFGIGNLIALVHWWYTSDAVTSEALAQPFSGHELGEDLEGDTLAAVGRGYSAPMCKMTLLVGPDLARGEVGSIA